MSVLSDRLNELGKKWGNRNKEDEDACNKLENDILFTIYELYTTDYDEDYRTVAVSGRVLVYVNCDVKVGDVLCADKDGFATVMSRQEIALFPDRILGIVSEIPSYEDWKSVKIDNRVWIKVN